MYSQRAKERQWTTRAEEAQKGMGVGRREKRIERCSDAADSAGP